MAVSHPRRKSDTASVKPDAATDQKAAGAKLSWSLTQSPYFPRLNLEALAHRQASFPVVNLCRR